MNLFTDKSCDTKLNAQRNLDPVCHYVCDENLRAHKSRVVYSGDHDKGLLFAIVTSDALDPHNTRRGFRYAIFDVFGDCIDRPNLDKATKTKQAALTAMYAALDKIDAKAHTLKANGERMAEALREFDEFARQVEGMQL